MMSDKIGTQLDQKSKKQGLHSGTSLQCPCMEVPSQELFQTIPVYQVEHDSVCSSWLQIKPVFH